MTAPAERDRFSRIQPQFRRAWSRGNDTHAPSLKFPANRPRSGRPLASSAG
jgi:hypothetical protein